MADDLLLVIGATGTQGGATARALLARGRRFRILVRNAAAPAAAALAHQGVEVAVGDLNRPETLRPAMQGVTGVFSVQRPDADGSDSERRHGYALIEAALAAGVRHFVQSSVCQAGTHASFPRWQEGYWAQKYWTDKWDVEQAVRAAGFAHWTILRPTFIMENFTRTKAQFLYPQMRQGVIVTPVRPEAKLQLIAGADIGAFAAAALGDPTRFGGRTIDLVGDTLTMEATCATLARALGKRLVLQSVSPAAALQAGIPERWVRSQEWINDVGYRADDREVRNFGVPLTSLADWAVHHAADLLIDA